MRDQNQQVCKVWESGVAIFVGKGKVAHEPQDTHTAGAYPGFCSMKQLRVLLLPPGWDASPSQGYPQQYVVGTHLYTWVEKDNVG